MSDSDALDIRWLHELPEGVQQGYFETRRQSYSDRWRLRLDLEGDFGGRDEYDGEHVVAALDGQGRIRGGVRANVIRSADRAERRLLPMEATWRLRLADIFPDHPLDRIDYAEASRLFVCQAGNWLEGQTITLRMLGFLLDQVPDVGITYFGLPLTLLRIYRLLARSRGIPYAHREIDGLRPHAGARGAAPVRWAVFACLLAASPQRADAGARA